MNGDIALLTIFVLSVFVGFEVISKVSTILHTPLMSGANAIHGVILVGAILVAGHAEGRAQLSLALVAVVLATVNIVGGFVVTDRMLEMFRRPDAQRAGAASAPAGSAEAAGAASAPAGGAKAARAAGAAAKQPAGARR